MIVSFRNRDTERFFRFSESRYLPPEIRVRALRKLYMLHSASQLSDMLIPRSNRLQALRGDRAGQHSIRINDQWRICFRWEAGGAHEVEIVDYH